MGRKWESLTDDQIEFIKNQNIFFVSTAPLSGRINLSPKGMDSFRVINQNKIIWLNYTGSGNETAAHLLEDSRMTVMFCSFDKKPLILRLYGNASAVYSDDTNWTNLISMFSDDQGARQIFEMNVDLIKTSCGESIPFYNYVAEREDLKVWYREKGSKGIRDYWQAKNTLSLDGKPTGIRGVD
ncbi:MAG: pyridoxamine 5'-phosphate oxidase family protein [Spirochaetia bacterium]|nr:pyridoxamine 5'-phosphate oxidase family protein [Spirochaetia bacterium]